MSKILNPDGAFSEEIRRRLLAEYFEAYDKLVDADLEGRDDDEAQQAVSRLWDEYLAGLPIVEISRNPFTNEAYAHSLDVYGLDGLWWNASNPNRPIEPLSEYVLAFTGSVALVDPIENVPFVCKPGPGVPFVVPRILGQEGVKAVLSSVPIGKHQGFVVLYFSQNELRTREGFGDWGRSIAFYDSDDVGFGWQEWIPSPSDIDFNLLPWIENGKLLWIAPGDDSLTLLCQTYCPYLSVDGNRFCQVVQEGEVWEDRLYDEAGDADEYEADEGFDPESTVEPAEQTRQEAEAPATKPESVPPVSTPPIAQPKFCRQCGAQLKPAAKFCPKCGAPTSK